MSLKVLSLRCSVGISPDTPEQVQKANGSDFQLMNFEDFLLDDGGVYAYTLRQLRLIIPYCARSYPTLGMKNTCLSCVKSKNKRSHKVSQNPGPCLNILDNLKWGFTNSHNITAIVKYVKRKDFEMLSKFVLSKQ